MTKLESDGIPQNGCITYMVTMDTALKMLTRGVLTPDDFHRFFAEMHRKYACEEVRTLYQAKFDLFIDQNINE